MINQYLEMDDVPETAQIREEMEYIKKQVLENLTAIEKAALFDDDHEFISQKIGINLFNWEQIQKEMDSIRDVVLKNLNSLEKTALFDDEDEFIAQQRIYNSEY
jgi:hypothetical protein